MSFFVYILASERNGTLYIGMTDDLARRFWEHRNGVAPGGVKQLVWYEAHDSREGAFARERRFARERQLKKSWRDLSDDLTP